MPPERSPTLRPPTRRAFLGLLILLGTASALLLTLPFTLPFFIFRPSPLDPRDPGRWGLPTARSVRFRTADGSTLSGWWIPPPSHAGVTVVVVHGRSANISTRASIASRLGRDGFGVLLFDYRGYGASEGRPSEHALTEDSLAAYAWTRRQGVDPRRIVVIGQSLGNAPAASLAASRPIAGLVLVSPFASLPEAVGDRLPWLPLRVVPWNRNRFDVARPLRHSRAPLVLIASRTDDLVPIAHARSFARTMQGPVRGIEMPSAPHDGLLAAAAESGALTRALRAIPQSR